MYNELTSEIIDKIKSVSDHVFTGEDINADYCKDEMPIYGTNMPDMAVQPRSVDEFFDVIYHGIVGDLNEVIPALIKEFS